VPWRYLLTLACMSGLGTADTTWWCMSTGCSNVRDARHDAVRKCPLRQVRAEAYNDTQPAQPARTHTDASEFIRRCTCTSRMKCVHVRSARSRAGSSHDSVTSRHAMTFGPAGNLDCPQRGWPTTHTICSSCDDNGIAQRMRCMVPAFESPRGFCASYSRMRGAAALLQPSWPWPPFPELQNTPPMPPSR
jgi:hypothetical protein